MCQSNSPSKSLPPIILIHYLQLPWCNFSILWILWNIHIHLTEVPTPQSSSSIRSAVSYEPHCQRKGGGMTGCCNAVTTRWLTLAATDIPGIAQRIFGTTVLLVKLWVHWVWDRRTTYLLCSCVPSFYMDISLEIVFSYASSLLNLF